MKKIVNISFSFLFFLSACSATTATPLASTAIPVMPTITEISTPFPSETPTETLTPTPIPSLESLPVTQKSINEFVSAMQKAGINVTAEQILQKGLQTQTVLGADGKEYQIATAHLDPDPSKPGEALEGDYPLMIKTEKGWDNINLREASDIRGIDFGVSLPEDWYFKGGRRDELQIASGNFNALAAQGLYLLWDKPPNQRTETDYLSHDKIFTFAKENDINSIIGLHLVWGYPAVTPEWLKSLDKEQLLKVINEHVTEVVKRYPDVRIWSVVNEPYRNSEGIIDFWGSKFPADYSWIETAFTAAYIANPNAALILNDYGIEIPDTTTYNQSKTQKLLDIGKWLKQDNVPVSGIGFQMHLYAKDFSNPSKTENLMKGFAQNIKQFQDVYGSVIITEFDLIADSNDPTAQAKAYDAIIRTALENGIKEIIIFGVMDRDSWKPDDRPLLFDENLKPKISYYAVLSALLIAKTP